ncbi:MAG: exodeoxyribonuclease VII large subunit [Dehalococcoidia bacterium]|nr:MAG: exodeoxyribonuclease VII large subunit [Dehalococcoidia bacterium]
MKIYSVAEVTGYLRELLETDSLLADLWISGEVSNLSESAAGHLYFTLKDEASQLRCVLFRRGRLALPLEGGVAVVAHGRISIYEVAGTLQFYVDLVQPEGIGILHLEFERLKAKLEEEGLFDVARKRGLPPFPRRIGVVTSPTGAVFSDIANIISRRYPLVELVLSPTPVQGDGASEGIVQAFEALNETEGIDLVILARGGGSLEELWAFNEERVARAIFSSKAPVISGVGHDTDFTIADFVADLRAPTPSAAAELAVPHRSELESRIQSHRRSLLAALWGEISQRRSGVDYMAGRLKSLSPDVDRYRQRIEELTKLASMHLGSFLAINREKLRSQQMQLSTLSPIATLSRGYAQVQHSTTWEVISRIAQVHRGDVIDVRVSDGQFKGKVTGLRKGLQAWMSNFPSKKG